MTKGFHTTSFLSLKAYDYSLLIPSSSLNSILIWCYSTLNYFCSYCSLLMYQFCSESLKHIAHKLDFALRPLSTLFLKYLNFHRPSNSTLQLPHPLSYFSISAFPISISHFIETISHSWPSLLSLDIYFHTVSPRPMPIPTTISSYSHTHSYIGSKIIL